ncbi:energy-coupling factor ABC transporter ATP-binding protein [Maritimibacter alkaliphilus]|uniref:energy-coupling factor ABC transporter ATP-binding protein n=1 Tax=Maritimibacter alkaliphilus TaxID=404236 RepID=UPI001C98724E|nr:ABC transporter ATP-binding protein [Maritimibacter alkaliphilus]MBY6090717.1 energy-coupling factor ABC transporter ATP-binding protein [Maritimibacter alkaliphilus]
MAPFDRPDDLLRLEDLRVAHDGRDVLGPLTLDITARRTGIVGRNGSGKTTLARVVAGLQAPTAGRVTLSGIDPAKDRRGALDRVGILFQNPDHQIIFPTVEEEITFGLRQQGRSKAEAAAAVTAILTRFDKLHWRAAATHSLSQGQKQLVCLMAVLVMGPRWIVLDEPFSGLDIATRLQLMRHMARIEARILMISHDPESFAGYDRVIWLEGGALREDGPAAPVLARFTAQMRQWGDADDLSHLAG